MSTDTKSTKKPNGFVHDPAGDFSSKRLESLMSFGFACLTVVGGLVAHSLGVDLSTFPLTQLVIAFLSYSGAMQGTAVFSERNLYPNGANTSSSTLSGENESLPNNSNNSSGIIGTVENVIGKITGQSAPTIDTSTNTNDAVSAPQVTEIPTSHSVQGK